MSNSFPFEDLLRIAERECCAHYPGLRLVPLDANALKDWRSQWGNMRVKRLPRFLWNEIAQENAGDENRIGWAIYIGKELCGLVAGYIEMGDKKILNLGMAEASPKPDHAMKGKIGACTVAVAEAIAIHGKLDSVQAHAPFEASVPFYEARGYTPNGRPGFVGYYLEKLIVPTL